MAARWTVCRAFPDLCRALTRSSCSDLTSSGGSRSSTCFWRAPARSPSPPNCLASCLSLLLAAPVTALLTSRTKALTCLLTGLRSSAYWSCLDLPQPAPTRARADSAAMSTTERRSMPAPFAGRWRSSCPRPLAGGDDRHAADGRHGGLKRADLSVQRGDTSLEPEDVRLERAEVTLEPGHARRQAAHVRLEAGDVELRGPHVALERVNSTCDRRDVSGQPRDARVRAVETGLRGVEPVAHVRQCGLERAHLPGEGRQPGQRGLGVGHAGVERCDVALDRGHAVRQRVER